MKDIYIECPVCHSELTADVEVYVRWGSNEVVGCEFCIRDCWADEFADSFEAENREMAEGYRQNYLYERRKEERLWQK